MTEEREDAEQQKRKQQREREEREQRERKKGEKKGLPAAIWSIVKRTENLQVAVKKSELPTTEKKDLERELENIKGKAKEKPKRAKGPIGFIQELLDIIELELKLDNVEEKIIGKEVTEAWKETQDSLQKIQQAINKGQLNRKQAERAVEELLKEIKRRGEKIDNQNLKDKIDESLEELQGQIRETGPGKREDRDEIINGAEEARGEPLTPEERNLANRLIDEIYTREPIFTKDDLEIIAQHSRGPKEQQRAEELVMKKVNEIFQVIDANPAADWHTAMSIEDSIKLSIAHKTLYKMGDWGQRLSQKLMGENNLRRYLFTLNYGIERGGFKPDKLPEHMSGFTNELRGVLVNIEGASTAARLWELGFEKLLMHYDYVPYELVAYDHTGRSELGDWVKARFKDYLDKKYLEEKRQHPDLSKEEFYQRVWPDWKINRAISVGKGNGLVSLSLVAISAKGKLPLEAQGMYSPWGEDFVRTINVNYHLYNKFGQGYPAQAMFQYFILTGEKPPPGLSTKELLRLITKEKAGRWKGLGEGKKRLIDKVNLLGAGGPWTRSEWRAMLAAGHIEGESVADLQHLGTNLSLILLKERLKPKDEAKWEGGVEEIWIKALKRDALQIIRETEIFNEPLEQLLEQILSESKLKKEERKECLKQISDQIKEFPPDERMKHLVLLDFLIQREPNWQQKWQELNDYDPEKTPRWQRMKVLKRKDEYLDKIENEYLLAREAMVSQIERTGKDVGFDIGKLSDKIQAYLRSIDKIAHQLRYKFQGKEMTLLDALIERTLKKEEEGGGFPLGLSSGDTAWKLLEFGAEGQQALHRRYRDFGDASGALGMIVGILWKFPEYQKNPLKFVEDAKALHTQITNYAPDIATEVCEHLLEGFIRASDGDLGIKFLPFPFDRLYDMFVRSSYAEQVLGEGALSLKAVDKRNLIKYFREMGMLATWDDMTGKDKEKKLFGRLGAQWWRVGIEFLIKYGPFGILFIFWQIWEEYKEKTEQAFK